MITYKTVSDFCYYGLFISYFPIRFAFVLTPIHVTGIHTRKFTLIPSTYIYSANQCSIFFFFIKYILVHVIL
jgi:hypothetical protein